MDKERERDVKQEKGVTLANLTVDSNLRPIRPFLSLPFVHPLS